jgi:hypothetical protein
MTVPKIERKGIKYDQNRFVKVRREIGQKSIEMTFKQFLGH